MIEPFEIFGFFSPSFSMCYKSLLLLDIFSFSYQEVISR